MLAERAAVVPAIDPLVNPIPTMFNATITLRVPEQSIRYTPPASEVLKWAWVQYIAFWAPVAFLLFRLSSFVFRHQLLYTYTVVDVVAEKMD
jgi:hypothetical protein